MAKLWILVYIALITLFHSEVGAVERVFRTLDSRAAYYGGYALSLDSESNCPSGSFSCPNQSSANSVKGGPCCPDSTVCIGDDSTCCPDSNPACGDAVAQSPTCADPSWILWTIGNIDFVCCPVGTVVDDYLDCVSPGESGPSSQVTAWTSETQGNNAAPTGGMAGSSVGSAAAPSITTPSQGSTPISTGATASATKKSSAEKNFVGSSDTLVLLCALALLSLLL